MLFVTDIAYRFYSLKRNEVQFSVAECSLAWVYTTLLHSAQTKKGNFHGILRSFTVCRC